MIYTYIIYMYVCMYVLYICMQGVVGGRRSVEQIETEEALGGEREIVGGKRLRSRRSGRFIQS